MKRIRYNITILILSLLFSNYVIAEKNKTNSNSSNNNKSTHSISAGCTQATTSTNLELNNVRAMIHTGGDMWWDLQGTAEYEVPKGSGKTAFFAGSIWIGGKDINGQLKLAAIQFRSSGTDYWTGPLIVDGPELQMLQPTYVMNMIGTIQFLGMKLQCSEIILMLLSQAIRLL